MNIAELTPSNAPAAPLKRADEKQNTAANANPIDMLRSVFIRPFFVDFSY